MEDSFAIKHCESSFNAFKRHILATIGKHDRSPKGSLDTPLLPFIHAINSCGCDESGDGGDFVTLSSCSGRTVLFQRRLPHQTKNIDDCVDTKDDCFDKNNDGPISKGGRWLLSEHRIVVFDEVWSALAPFRQKDNADGYEMTHEGDGDEALLHETFASCELRFEPLLLHIACRSLKSAAELLEIAVASGYRESGIGSPSSRPVVYIRCGIRLEAPIVDANGQLLASKTYVQYLAHECNRRFIQNFERMQRFESAFRKRFDIRQPNDISQLSCTISTINKQSDHIPVIICLKQVAGKIRTACRTQDWNDTDRKPFQIEDSFTATEKDELLMAVPLKDKAAQYIEAQLAKGISFVDILKLNNSCGPLKLRHLPEETIPHKSKAAIHHRNQKSLLVRPLISTSQKADLQDAVRAFVREKFLAEELLNDVPHRYDRFGDMLLLPATAFISDAWKQILQDRTMAQSFWFALAEAVGAARVARQQTVSKNDILRKSRVQLLLGDSAVVEHTEHGILYRWDAAHIMFSRGNLNEKVRLLARVQSSPTQSSDVIADLYAGIGYWSLMLLKKTSVQHVHLFEINDASIRFLKENLEHNRIERSRYSIWEGDNRLSPAVHMLRGTVDRVILGLLPSSEHGWPLAVQLLKPRGGFLHVHANVPTSRHGIYASQLEQRLGRIDQAQNRFRFCVRHIQFVKQWAPHIDHLVIDVEAVPASTLPLDSILPNAAFTKDLRTFKQTVPIFDSKDSNFDFWSNVYAPGLPAIIRNIDLGSCTSKWTLNYLYTLKLDNAVSVHVCPELFFDFVNRNFSYRTMTFSDFIARILSPTDFADTYYISPKESLYLRALGEDPRKEPANLSSSFPELSIDFKSPTFLNDVQQHSSVLRISSPNMRLFTHCDTVQNLLCHISGEKRISLWPPSQWHNLHVSPDPGSCASPVDVDAPDVQQWPRFSKAAELSWEALLSAGDCIYIPPLWFHGIRTGSTPSISVNLFWQDKALFNEYSNKDVYGNHPLKSGQKAALLARDIVDRTLSNLPEPYHNYYRSRAGFYVANDL